MTRPFRAVRVASVYLDRFSAPIITQTFTLGTTFPTPGLHAGPDPAHTLTPYTGPNAGGVLTITTPTTFTDVDFGTTQIICNSSDVEFYNCKWTNRKAARYNDPDIGPMVNCRNGTNYSGRYFYRCAFDNAHQMAPQMNGVIGYGYTAERCTGQNTQDIFGIYVPASRPDTDCDVDILGCHLDNLAFWAAPTGGIVHPSDIIDHADCIQWQGGTGLRIEGTFLGARYSTTIGTGTPNSGNDTGGLGANLASYTQAAGVTRRFEVVEGSGTYSAGTRAPFMGGSLSGLMLSPSARGTDVSGLVLKNNWGSGGGNWLNGGNDQNHGTIAEISGNRIDNNQASAGKALVLDPDIVVTNFGSPPNTWTDGSGVITRRTG